MSLPFVGPGGRGFSLVLMIQFPKYSAFGLVLGNCIICTKENPRPPGPPHGNVSFLRMNLGVREFCMFLSLPGSVCGMARAAAYASLCMLTLKKEQINIPKSQNWAIRYSKHIYSRKG